MKNFILLIAVSLISVSCFAQEQISTLNQDTNNIVNEEIRKLRKNTGVGTYEIKNSSIDTTKGYTSDKIVAGDGISITTVDPGGDETLKISSTIAGGFNSMQVFTSSETWTKPAGVTKVLVKVWGAGGGGGGCNGGGGGGSGGSGGYAESVFTVSGDVTVTIGAKGTGGYNGNGINATAGAAGGDSSFSTVVGGGGAGGAANTTTSIAVGGQSGIGSGGTFNTRCFDGMPSKGGTGGAGGVGGLSTSGSTYGTGGNGGQGEDYTYAPDGVAGLVIVYW